MEMIFDLVKELSSRKIYFGLVKRIATEDLQILGDGWDVIYDDFNNCLEFYDGNKTYSTRNIECMLAVITYFTSED